MARQDVIRQALEQNPQIVEVEVEYKDGSEVEFLLEPGNTDARSEGIDKLVDSVDWERVEEVEVEFANGRKSEIDLKAGLKTKRANRRTRSNAASEAAETSEGAAGLAEVAVIGNAIQGDTSIDETQAETEGTPIAVETTGVQAVAEYVPSKPLPYTAEEQPDPISNAAYADLPAPRPRKKRARKGPAARKHWGVPVYAPSVPVKRRKSIAVKTKHPVFVKPAPRKAGKKTATRRKVTAHRAKTASIGGASPGKVWKAKGIF